MRVRIYLNDGNSFAVERAEVVKLLWPTEERAANPDMRMFATERTCEINMAFVVAFVVEAEERRSGASV